MAETVDYSVVRSYDDIEIRRYPKLIIARVEGFSGDNAFSILFQYISGGNRPRKKIAMTSPVISQSSTQQIEMTSPVISDESSFSFVMPAEYTLESIPEPVDDRIQITELPERTVAVKTFSGRAGERDVRSQLEDLLGFILENGIKTKGKPFLMRYNSPFVPGFLRRNEVAVEIEA